MTEELDRDEIIRSLASDYNRPPATPRDEMWAAIQAARVDATTGPRLHVLAGGAARSAHAQSQQASRFTHRSAWWGAAAAAVLLVATGVGIGRWSSSTASSGAPAVRQPATVAERDVLQL
jgi:hypothetical protein